MLPALQQQAARLGIAQRIVWRGALAQPDVLAAYRAADLFVLASKIAQDGDRDGLPNVLMEAQSQDLACLTTGVSAISRRPSFSSNSIRAIASDLFLLLAPSPGATYLQAATVRCHFCRSHAGCVTQQSVPPVICCNTARLCERARAPQRRASVSWRKSAACKAFAVFSKL